MKLSEKKKILKIPLGECVLDGTSENSLPKIFLINQLFTLNLTGLILLLVILVWNVF